MSDQEDNTSREFELTASPKSLDEERKSKRNAYMKLWSARNPEKVKATQRACYQAKREERLAKVKAYQESNRPEISAKRKIRYAANPENELAKMKEYREANKDKLREYYKAHYEANRDAVLTRVKHRHGANPGAKYGLTSEEYWGMVDACKGRCPCCKTPFSEILGKTMYPCVDHDHKKGQKREAVRGICCHQCNMLMGHAKDDPKILRACANHIERIKILF